jgi:hypothetical protein
MEKILLLEKELDAVKLWPTLYHLQKNSEKKGNKNIVQIFDIFIILIIKLLILNK